MLVYGILDMIISFRWLDCTGWDNIRPAMYEFTVNGCKTIFTIL